MKHNFRFSNANVFENICLKTREHFEVVLTIIQCLSFNLFYGLYQVILPKNFLLQIEFQFASKIEVFQVFEKNEMKMECFFRPVFYLQHECFAQL